MVDKLSTIDVCNVRDALKILSYLPKLYGKDIIELETFAPKPVCRWICNNNIVENLSVEAAPIIFVAPYLSDATLFTAKYFNLSFMTEQEFLVQEVAEQPKKRPSNKLS